MHKHRILIPSLPPCEAPFGNTEKNRLARGLTGR